MSSVRDALSAATAGHFFPAGHAAVGNQGGNGAFALGGSGFVQHFQQPHGPIPLLAGCDELWSKRGRWGFRCVCTRRCCKWRYSVSAQRQHSSSKRDWFPRTRGYRMGVRGDAEVPRQLPGGIQKGEKSPPGPVYPALLRGRNCRSSLAFFRECDIVILVYSTYLMDLIFL